MQKKTFTEITLSCSELEDLLREKFSVEAGFKLKEVLGSHDSKSFIITFEKIAKTKTVKLKDNSADTNKDTFLNSSFRDLGVDTRIINCLRTINIKTPKELIACPYAELLKIRNLGEISLRRLDGLLREHGFVLNEAWNED